MIARYWALVPLLFFLVSCSVLKKEPKGKPSTISYSMATDEELNPNMSGIATPIEVQIFELKDDSMFLSADFDQITKNAKKVLKSNYIDHNDYVLLPSKAKYVETFPINKNTRYIGVIARYAALNSSEWKKVVQVKPLGKEYHLVMFFAASEVKLYKVE